MKEGEIVVTDPSARALRAFVEVKGPLNEHGGDHRVSTQ